MKIKKVLLSILLGICVTPTYAVTFIIGPVPTKVYFKVKKIADGGEVYIFHGERLLNQGGNLDGLRAELKIGSEHQFFYNQTPLPSELTIAAYMEQYQPWKGKGVSLMAIPPSQVNFAMDYFPIEKKYRELAQLERYTYCSGAHVYLQVEGYVRRVEKELDTRVAKELKQLIALYTSIRCTPLYAPFLKKTLCNPIETKLLLTSAYKEHVGSLIFDLLTPFISENKPCDFLTTLPEKAICFLYMHKDHFLHVELLCWLTNTQKSPLRGDFIAEGQKSRYQLKKSCIDSLLAHGELPIPLLKKVVAKARHLEAWDVLVSLAYHGFLDRSWSRCTIPYASMWAPHTKKTKNPLKHSIAYYCNTAASDKEVFISLKKHPAMRYKLLYATCGQSVQNMCHLSTYTYTDMVKVAVLLSLVCVSAKYLARNYPKEPTIDSDNKKQS